MVKLDMYKEKNPLPVVLMAVFDKSKNRILLAKRKRPPYSGFYGILGGRQTFGLETKEVVKREVAEETGYAIKEDSVELRGFYNEILLDKSGKPKDHFIFRVCEVYVDKSVPRTEDVEKTDIEKFEWFDLPISGEVKGKIIPSDLIFINHVLSEDMYDFKEIIMKETDDPNKLEIVSIS